VTQRLDDLREQLRRDVDVLRGDPRFHGVDPGRELYERRIAAAREEILRLEKEGAR